MSEGKHDEATQAMIDALMEDLESIQIESDDIMPALQRVVKNYAKYTDHLEVASMLHAITRLFVDFFLDHSMKGKMDEQVVMTHWIAIASAMTDMIKVGYKERSLN